MADTTRSDSDAARIKRGTLSVKTKRKQPFVLESFLSHAGHGSRPCAVIVKLVKSANSQKRQLKHVHISLGRDNQGLSLDSPLGAVDGAGDFRVCQRSQSSISLRMWSSAKP